LLEVPDVVRSALEAVEGALCLSEVPEMMRCVLLCMLEAVDGGLCIREAVEVSEMLEVLGVIRCALFCMLEAEEDRFCLLEVLELVSLPSGDAHANVAGDTDSVT